VILGLEFPPIENLVEWPNWFGPEGSWYGFNKIAFISLVAIVATSIVFILGRKGSLVPKGAQNLAESAVGFIRDGIRYMPFLVSLFFFILIGNIFEVVPFFHMPANARMAGPAVLALLTWLFYICVGFRHQGPKYIINAVAPAGVPKPLYILVVPIEFLSTFIVRPFSLAVRLFANMLAGHILFFMLVALTGFEVMVAFLQAYIFTILAAVYIGSSLHAEH
jgi:F-type H+-transporting ATPase subunit a